MILLGIFVKLINKETTTIASFLIIILWIRINRPNMSRISMINFRITNSLQVCLDLINRIKPVSTVFSPLSRRSCFPVLNPIYHTKKLAYINTLIWPKLIDSSCHNIMFNYGDLDLCTPLVIEI